MTILFNFSLINSDDFLIEQAENPKVGEKMKSGFFNFWKCLNLYMGHEISKDESKVTIYGSVTIENGAIMYAVNNYYGKPLFSNVSIRMDSDELFDYNSDQGICYGQVII